jgi:hypothetical protein
LRFKRKEYALMVSTQNTAQEVDQGVWLITFVSQETTTGVGCTHLLPPLLESSKIRPIVMLASTPNDLKRVDLSLTNFWLNAIRRDGLRVQGMGVVTKHAAVRVALKGMQMALKLLSVPIVTDAFDDVDEAIAWGRVVVASR